VKRAGRVAFEADVGRPPLVGRLLGTDSKAYLTAIAATRTDPSRQTVPLKRACGRYLDWYGVAPGTSPQDLSGVPAPTPHPPEDDD
jgi:hypothetical protein